MLVGGDKEGSCLLRLGGGTIPLLMLEKGCLGDTPASVGDPVKGMDDPYLLMFLCNSNPCSEDPRLLDRDPPICLGEMTGSGAAFGWKKPFKLRCPFAGVALLEAVDEDFCFLTGFGIGASEGLRFLLRVLVVSCVPESVTNSGRAAPVKLLLLLPRYATTLSSAGDIADGVRTVPFELEVPGFMNMSLMLLL